MSDAEVVERPQVAQPERVRSSRHHTDVTRPTLRTQRILAGETLFGAWASLGSPGSAELLGRVRARLGRRRPGARQHDRGGAPRAPHRDRGAPAPPRSSGRSPASGCASGARSIWAPPAIVVPRLDTPEQVREAVTFLRYPPTGQRGVALLTRGARLGTVNHAGVAALNDDIVGIVQIESPSALEAADEFAATDGVDVLFVGPGGPVALARHPRPVREPDLPGRAAQASSPRAARTARRRGSCCTTTRRSSRTSTSATRSSASAPTSRS